MVRSNKIILLYFILLCGVYPLNAYLSTMTFDQNNVIEKIEFGTINWTEGIITITGESSLPKIIKDKNKIQSQKKQTKKFETLL